MTQDSVSFVLALQPRTLYKEAFYHNNLTSKVLKSNKKKLVHMKLPKNLRCITITFFFDGSDESHPNSDVTKLNISS